MTAAKNAGCVSRVFNNGCASAGFTLYSDWSCSASPVTPPLERELLTGAAPDNNMPNHNIYKLPLSDNHVDVEKKNRT